MGWDLDNIYKIEVMSLVGFSGETSRVIEKVTLPVETHAMAIYMKIMVIDAKST